MQSWLSRFNDLLIEFDMLYLNNQQLKPPTRYRYIIFTCSRPCCCHHCLISPCFSLMVPAVWLIPCCCWRSCCWWRFYYCWCSYCCRHLCCGHAVSTFASFPSVAVLHAVASPLLFLISMMLLVFLLLLPSCCCWQDRCCCCTSLFLPSYISIWFVYYFFWTILIACYPRLCKYRITHRQVRTFGNA